MGGETPFMFIESLQLTDLCKYLGFSLTYESNYGTGRRRSLELSAIAIVN